MQNIHNPDTESHIHIEATNENNNSIIISFVIALSAIIITSIIGIVLVVLNVQDASASVILIGAITSFVVTISASLIGILKSLLQIKTDINNKFTQLLKSKEDIGFIVGFKKDTVDNQSGDCTTNGK